MAFPNYSLNKYEQIFNEYCSKIYPGWNTRVALSAYSAEVDITVYKTERVSLYSREGHKILDVLDSFKQKCDDNFLRIPIVIEKFAEKDKEIQELKDLLKNVKVIAEEKANSQMIQGVVFDNDPLKEIREKVKNFELK